MTTLYLILGLFGAAAALGWLAVRQARERGRAEAEAATNKRMAENAETMGRIMAEHRDPDHAAERMRDNSF